MNETDAIRWLQQRADSYRQDAGYTSTVRRKDDGTGYLADMERRVIAIELEACALDLQRAAKHSHIRLFPPPAKEATTA